MSLDRGCFALCCHPIPASGEAAWHVLRVGGGGVISGMDIADSDGTKVARADTYGAYVCDAPCTSPAWKQIVTINSLPAGDAGVGVVSTSTPGVYELAIAQSNPKYFYMIFNGYVYSTSNHGTNWTRANRVRT